MMEDIIDYKEEPKPEQGIRKWLSGMVDAILVLAFCLLGSLVFQDVFIYGALRGVPFPLFVLVTFLCYRFIFLLVFAKTIGMLVFRLKFQTEYFENPGLRDRIAAAFFIMLNGVDYYREIQD